MSYGFEYVTYSSDLYYDWVLMVLVLVLEDKVDETGIAIVICLIRISRISQFKDFVDLQQIHIPVSK